MKKLLIVATLLISSFATFAQTKADSSVLAAKTTVIANKTDSAKLTAAKVYSDVKAGLVGLSAALKTGVEHVYTVLVRQQIVQSIVYTLVYLLLSFFVYRCYTIFTKNYRRTTVPEDTWYRDDIDEHANLLIPLLVGLLLSVVGLILFACTISDTITGFVNPEYGAIKDIINFIK